MWIVYEEDVQISERDRKLRTRSNAPAGGQHVAFFVSNEWRFRADRAYTAKIDYKLRPDGVAADQWVAVGIGASIEHRGNEIIPFAYVSRTRNGLSLGVRVEVNDVTVTELETPINTDRGELKIEYDPSSNKLKVRIDGETIFRVNNFIEDPGARLKAHVLLGVIRSGGAEWGWNDVWIDNFKIKGRIR